MSTADLQSVDDYLTALRQNGLIVSTELDAAVAKFAESGGEQTTDAIGKYLIEQKLLTLWQHRRVLKGNARQCFLDKYKLLAPINPKGGSTTFLAVHTRMRRKVGIKLLPLRHDSGPDALEKFLCEAETVARLDHDNIVRAYEVDNKGDLFYLVMEYVEGKALSRVVMENGPLEFRTAVEYLRQAAEGLAHAHAASIVHHDVKPSNLLLSSTGTVKVLELGVARLGEQDSPGKAGYAAPEQITDGGQISERTDVYGLGASLYYLLTGRPPFEGKRSDEAQPIASLRPDVPPELAAMCRWMMAVDPADRPKSARRVGRMMSKWLAGEAFEIPEPGPIRREPETPAAPQRPAPVVDAIPPGETPEFNAKVLLLSVLLVALISLVAWGAVVGKL